MHKGWSLMATCVVLAGATYAVAHGTGRNDDAEEGGSARAPAVAQVVALDECDPTSFNTALGESGGGFCHNVALAALGYATTLDELFRKAREGTPDPGWDFEPDQLSVARGTVVSVADQGGEPHTFTEVKRFGGGFVGDLNHGEATVPECEGGFANVAVARTRITQGSHADITNLAPGKHLFQCCIHPWMRMEIDVK
jgi:plastocyanin